MDISILQNLIEQTDVVVWVISPDLQQAYYVSPAYERVFGQPCERFYTSPSVTIDILHPSDRDNVLHSLIWQRQGQPTSLEYRIVDSNGQIRWLQTHTFPIRDKSNHLAQTIGITHDYTNRKEAVESTPHAPVILGSSVTQDIVASPDFCTALQSLLVKVCVIADWPFGEVWIPNSTETELVMSNVWYGGDTHNPLHLKFHEMSQELTLTMGEGLPGRVWKSQCPEWQEDVSTLPKHIYLRADVARQCNFRTALGIPLAVDGIVLAILVLYRSEARPEDKALIELLLSMTHLSVVIQKQHNKAIMRQVETKYRRIFENAVEGIFQSTTGDGGRYLMANMMLARIYGYDSPDDLMNSITNISEQLYVDPKTREKLENLLRLEGKACNFEAQVYRKDGRKIWISETTQPVYNAKGEAIYYEGSLKDITEQKKARDRIEQLNSELEERVRQRTADLERANSDLLREIEERQRTEMALRESEISLQQQAQQLSATLQELKQTQLQLIQTEKISSLGQLVTGIAHEVNNPINFVSANLDYLQEHIQELVKLLKLYQQSYPSPLPEIDALIEDIDLDYMMEDIEKILGSMEVGTKRIEDIVRSLRTFARLDTTEVRASNLHDGIESTLTILRHRLQGGHNYSTITLERHYGQLPQVECCPGLVNQVFMNLLANAIDAIDEYRVTEPVIAIATESLDGGNVAIRISNNGPAVSADIQSRLFDPFFTTKPEGKGTGLGLSLSYKIIVEQHRGKLYYRSPDDGGSEFIIELPVRSRVEPDNLRTE